jgi:hypothetical protein
MSYAATGALGAELRATVAPSTTTFPTFGFTRGTFVPAPQDCLDPADRDTLERYAYDPDTSSTPPEPLYTKYRQRSAAEAVQLPKCEITMREAPREIPRMREAKTCLKGLEALFIAGCMADPSIEGCATFASDPANLALLGLKLCPGEPRAGVPQCADAALRQALSYCEQYGFQGPDKRMNGLCWLSQTAPEYDAALKALAPCPSGTRSIRLPTRAARTAPADVPAEPPLPVPPPVTPATIEYGKKRNLMTVGILGAVALAVGVGGYAWYRKKKKGG